MQVQSLGYVVIEATDLQRWKEYATGVCGLMEAPGMRTENSLYFKMDQRPFRYLIVQGERDGLLSAGWKLQDEQALTDGLKTLDAQGIAYEEITDQDFLASRAVNALVRVNDPAGNVLELYWADEKNTDDGITFKSPLDVAQFITRADDDSDMGLGHVVLHAPQNFEQTHDFYKALGFKDSDITDLGAQHMGKIYFMCCNPRHHSLALWSWGAPTPETDFKPSPESSAPGCVHLMMEVGSLTEVGRCLDRVGEKNIMLTSTLGEHINDEMTSFYMLSPGNFAIEFGCHGLQLDESHQTTHNTQASKWGHKWTG